MEHGAEILRQHVALFLGAASAGAAEAEAASESDSEAERERLRIRRILIQPVDELELSVRAHNCLKAASIKTLADLVSLQESDLLKFRNFGRKSLSELTDVVYQNNLTFGMDVSPYLQDETNESEVSELKDKRS